MKLNQNYRVADFKLRLFLMPLRTVVDGRCILHKMMENVGAITSPWNQNLIAITTWSVDPVDPYDRACDAPEHERSLWTIGHALSATGFYWLMSFILIWPAWTLDQMGGTNLLVLVLQVDGKVPGPCFMDDFWSLDDVPVNHLHQTATKISVVRRRSTRWTFIAWNFQPPELGTEIKRTGKEQF